jgi:hypothetical protein
MRDVFPATAAGGAEPTLSTIDEMALDRLAGQL